MRIAFVSYEYPPDTGYGGIGTYVLNAAKLMARRGHEVEVFSGSADRDVTTKDGGILIHRTRAQRREQFSQAVIGLFRLRHQDRQFDVIESPEYFHEGAAIAEAFPYVPLIVKLHSPSLLLSELQGGFPDLGMRADLGSYWPQVRRLGRAFLERRTLPRWSWSGWQRALALERDADERAFAARADLVVSPSMALLDLMRERWQLDPDRLFHAPNPFNTPDALLKIVVETQWNVVSYFGRLETRKGLVELGRAMLDVLERRPKVKFRFVGENGPSPEIGLNYEEYLRRAAGPFADRLEFTGRLPLNETYRYFSLTDICVFPSVWENFPNVCLEAMAAGRGIVGSNAGGMAEMLVHEESGLIVDPARSGALANAIIALLDNPELRMSMGRQARERLLAEYASEKAAARLEQSFVEASSHSRVSRQSPP